MPVSSVTVFAANRHFVTVGLTADLAAQLRAPSGNIGIEYGRGRKLRLRKADGDSLARVPTFYRGQRYTFNLRSAYLPGHVQPTRERVPLPHRWSGDALDIDFSPILKPIAVEQPA